MAGQVVKNKKKIKIKRGNQKRKKIIHIIKSDILGTGHYLSRGGGGGGGGGLVQYEIWLA